MDLNNRLIKSVSPKMCPVASADLDSKGRSPGFVVTAERTVLTLPESISPELVYIESIRKVSSWQLLELPLSLFFYTSPRKKSSNLLIPYLSVKVYFIFIALRLFAKSIPVSRFLGLRMGWKKESFQRLRVLSSNLVSSSFRRFFVEWMESSLLQAEMPFLFDLSYEGLGL